MENDPEQWKELHNKVIERYSIKELKIKDLKLFYLLSANEILKLKGYTSWAIGLSVAFICNAILRNEKKVIALSTYVKVNKQANRNILSH
jgi:malate/lactate dehydrogenase